MESSPHILVVDDHREIRELLSRYLKQHGFRVSTAEGGEVMRRTLRAGAVDLVVLDIMMPGEDGLTLCRHLRETTELPVIMLTAVAYGQRARVTLNTAADAILIVIDDEGRGIPEAASERVFEPFVRLEESRNPETGGIGLGMSIARSIVRGHGGDISLKNRPKDGLRVSVHLPRHEQRRGNPS